jgi:hypothetical protein
MEIKAKNVECLKALISVAQTDGNYLGEAWYDVSLRQIRMIIIINKISMRFS